MTRWLLLLSLALAAAPRAADWTLTVVAPVSLESAAGRIRSLDPHVMADALQRAGLALPPRLQVTLIPEDDPRATAVPPGSRLRRLRHRDLSRSRTGVPIRFA